MKVKVELRLSGTRVQIRYAFRLLQDFLKTVESKANVDIQQLEAERVGKEG